MPPPRIDYTARDWDSILAAFDAHLRAKFPDTWQNFYTSGIGTAWKELVAYSYEILSFYLDYQANELYIDTLRDRLSIVNLGKLVGYRLRPATSAAVTVTATIAAVQATDVIILAGTTLVSTSGVTFRVLTEQRIPAGDLSAEIVFTEGELHSDTFVSDGSTFQKFTLSDPEVIDGSIEVTVDGTEWTEVTSLVFGTNTSTVYAVTYDEEDYGYIEFGDGSNGLIPPNGSSAVAAYRVGGGVSGNIALNDINTAITGQTDALPSVAIQVTVINDLQPGSGGEPRETLEHARFWMKQWVATNGRAVTENDFDALATAFNDSTFGALAYAKAALRQEIPELNTVDIYTWARDGSGNIVAPSFGLQQALQSYFDNNGEGAVRLICVDVEVLDGFNVYIDVSVSIAVETQYAAVEVSLDVSNALDTLFTSASVRPGEAFRISRVYDQIQDTTGVDHSLIDMLTASYLTEETVAIGNGVTSNYVFTLTLDTNLPIVPLTVSISAGAQVASDDGNGSLVLGGVTIGTVNYATGAVNLTFPVVPILGETVDAEYRHILDYQRGEVELTATGVATLTGAVNYPPIVAFDPASGEKGIAFTDGTQVVTDALGNGILYSGVTIVGAIDYDTGAFSVTFPATPALGTSISSTYRQRLQSPSEDIPIDKFQLAVKGLYSITTS